ncbi:hypothetical protein KORDIASMS9_04685 [Kordia sp. SMS9]|uniref:DUF2306 domain-containing protein n=1 Tax=Kordia sp. SMS9 TaxID=2282170 RepID=UPI000E0D5DF1|nr:DUF2306 domain-containing protein [Kordia sp. SMS9]AXG72411.1 hypothetical protein KORDIASMS9_04685 [Kordia sp. SMS9]
MEQNFLNIGRISGQKKANTLGDWVFKISMLIFGIISAYYLIIRALPFLIISEEIYNPYYYSRVVWIWPHVLGGVIAMIIGPFQFIPRIRIKYPRFHRVSGYIFLISILVSALTLVFLITTSSSSLVIDVGLGIGGLVWLVTAILSFVAIKNRKVAQHREWMVRCYMITLAFVVFRLVIDIFSSLELTNEPDIVALASWMSWTLPMCVTEVIIQGRKIIK